PKATHLTSYSYRVRRSSNVALLEGLGRRCRQVGLYRGEAGFNLDFHTIRHHGEQVPLEDHYVAARSQRTRSVLTFFAQDHASTEMVYANADVTKAQQARRRHPGTADGWLGATGRGHNNCERHQRGPHRGRSMSLGRTQSPTLFPPRGLSREMCRRG
ncbi:MAG: hypothetical protein ACRDYV_15520, partial [Acidimicrobiia bacterium]